jgi:hypothetical protein
MTFQKGFAVGLTLLGLFLSALPAAAASPSKATETCLACHDSVTPGIVADWEASRHSWTAPEEAMKKPDLEKRITVDSLPDDLAHHAVGCAECHTANPDAHPDSFDHNGFRVHTIVTPRDCAVCHPVEVDEYARNAMSQAHGNLNGNPLYRDLIENALGTQQFTDGALSVEAPNQLTESDACNYCHGTVVEFQGLADRETEMGTMKLPRYSGWPNQGVGRVNPDGSKGSCSACHARHQFSIEVARKPYTCGECHKGPDVPAYKVYMASKHGNLFSSLWREWDFSAVPWTVGRDFTAPTCAACHASLVVTREGEVLSQRTHQFNDRSSWRIFGLPYAHPHPKDPDTTRIKNRNGLPLPTTLAGEYASEYLIGEEEQQDHRATMKRVCSGCHTGDWIDGHFEQFDNTVEVMNDKTLTATRILLDAYDSGVARGPADKDSLFNEGIEKMWVEAWLFYANSTRFSSAMAGADYGVFANGRWWMNKNIAEMADHLKMLKAAQKAGQADKE